MFERREEGGEGKIQISDSVSLETFTKQKAAVNDTRAVLKAKQINTLQDEGKISPSF